MTRICVSFPEIVKTSLFFPFRFKSTASSYFVYTGILEILVAIPVYIGA